MKLKEYLKEHHLTQKQFLLKIQAKTGQNIPQSTIAKYLNETRIPRKKEMLNIYLSTNKEVQPNDFYGIN